MSHSTSMIRHCRAERGSTRRLSPTRQAANRARWHAMRLEAFLYRRLTLPYGKVNLRYRKASNRIACQRALLAAWRVGESRRVDPLSARQCLIIDVEWDIRYQVW